MNFEVSRLAGCPRMIMVRIGKRAVGIFDDDEIAELMAACANALLQPDAKPFVRKERETTP